MSVSSKPTEWHSGRVVAFRTRGTEFEPRPGRRLEGAFSGGITGKKFSPEFYGPGVGDCLGADGLIAMGHKDWSD